MGAERNRVARGLTAATACTLLGYLGHTDAGGARPSAAVVLALAVPLTALTILLANRRRGPVTILALVGGSQLALHQSMQLLGGGSTGPGMADMPGMSASILDPASGSSAMSPVLMSGAHLVATLVTAAVLCGAEQAALTWAIVLIETLLPAPVNTFPVPSEQPCRLRVNGVPANLRLRDVLTRRINLRRGPPPVPVSH